VTSPAANVQACDLEVVDFHVTSDRPGSSTRRHSARTRPRSNRSTRGTSERDVPRSLDIVLRPAREVRRRRDDEGDAKLRRPGLARARRRIESATRQSFTVSSSLNSVRG